MVTMTRTTLSPDILRVDDAADDVTRVAVSTVIFTLRRDPATDCVSVVLPLVPRTRDPHEGLWALPGGWLDARESLDAAASRTLAETTGGAYHPAADAAELATAASGIDMRLTVARQDVPLAGGLTGLALALLVAGAVLTTLRTGRLV